MKSPLFFFFILIFSCSKLFAQFPVKHYSVDDGLPVNGVWDINQDDKGFLWLGTLDGFCRFDGYDFNIYKNNPADSTSISSNTRHVSYIDKDQKIWISHNSGVSVFDPATEKFDNIFKYDQSPGKDMANVVFGKDKSNEVWAWITGRGLICFDQKTKKKIGEYASPEFINENCGSAVVDAENNVWIALYPHGLLHFNATTKKFERKFENYFIYSVALCGKDELVLGGNQSIIHYFISSGKFSVARPAPGSQAVSGQNFIFLSIIEADKGKFFLSSTTGIFSWSVGDSTYHHFDFSSNKIENNVYIDCLFKDRSGNIWVGTNGAGLLMIAMNCRHFNLLEPHDENQTIVKSICNVGPITWIGYFLGGIDLYNSENHQLIDHADMSNSNLPSNSVYAIYPYNDHAAFLKFIYSNDVGIFDWQTKKFTSLVSSFDQALPGYVSKASDAEFICKNPNGNLFFNRRQYILELSPGNENSVVIYDSLLGQNFTYGMFDRQNQFWAGTFDGVYVKNKKGWEKIDLGVTMLTKCIIQNSNGDIWASGDKGIFVIDKNHKVKTWYNERNGLPNEYVYGLLQDDDQNIWFSHNKGISCFNTAQGTFLHYTKSDGLQSDEFDTGGFFKGEDGIIYFGGIKGVNYFDPRTIKNNLIYPITNLVDIKINDREFISDSAFHLMHFLSLPYDSNTISFEFVSNEFTNQEKSQYQYRLIGIDKDWVKSDRNRNVRYPNLPPGSYTFEVKSSNNDGLWETNPASFSFRIIPPFYKTTWFYFLAGFFILFLFATAAFLFFRQRLRKQERLLEVQKKLQDERERISMDLHDNVGTQLSLISNNIQWLAHPLVEISEDEKIKRLDDVTNMSKEVIYTLRETIWALNKTEIELDEFSDKLKAFVQKQLDAFSSTELKFKENINLPVVLGPSEALHLFRICQEAIANVLKHSECTLLEISIESLADGKYKIRINDNGKGFEMSENAAEASYGLQNMKHRASAIGANFTIQSEKEKGTAILISKE
jgi:signal transduction histidine kinase/ligand-binding sensor domain-containing protein